MEIKKLFFLIFTISSLMALFGAVAATTTYTCHNATTLNKTTDITIGSTQTIISEQINCTHGCLNGECRGTFIDADINAIWLVYAIGMILLVLGTVLGMPYGKFSGQEEIRGFDTTMVVKYMFFFVGFYFVYLSLGMSRRLGDVYSADSNIIGATNTATMVIMITMILFLFIFVTELLFTVIKWWGELAEKRKWGEREE